MPKSFAVNRSFTDHKNLCRFYVDGPKEAAYELDKVLAAMVAAFNEIHKQAQPEDQIAIADELARTHGLRRKG